METGALTLANIIENVGTVLTGLLGFMTDIVTWIFATPGVAVWAYAALILIAFAAVARFVKR